MTHKKRKHRLAPSLANEPVGIAPGYPCPDCGRHLTASLDQLLSGSPILCSSCGLELRLDQEGSQETLKALRELRTQLDGTQQAHAAAAGVGAIADQRPREQ